MKRGEIPIYEPGLEALVARNAANGRLSFTTDLRTAVAGADAVLIAVGTPSRRGDGHADLSYVFAAAREIGQAIDGYTVVVTKSTVPVGTGRKVAEEIRAVRPDADFDLASNPEFLREGSAIADFMRPDRVVIGAEADRAAALLRRVYQPLNLIEVPMVVTTLEAAEIIKYAANSFLAMKITFINEVADLCEKAGADVHAVSKGIGLDGRIGRKFLHPGPGYGGSCFPKDTLAFATTAQDFGSPLKLVEATIDLNERRKARMADKVIQACGGSVAGKAVGILGLTFKPETDDMRDSPSLVIVPTLAQAGATIRAYDPHGRREAEALMPDITYTDTAAAAIQGADCVVIITEWNEFRALDLAKVKAAMAGTVLVDLRNVFDPAAARAAGLDYVAVGR